MPPGNVGQLSGTMAPTKVCMNRLGVAEESAGRANLGNHVANYGSRKNGTVGNVALMAGQRRHNNDAETAIAKFATVRNGDTNATAKCRP